MMYNGVYILVMQSTYIYAASHSNKPTLDDLQCFLEFQRRKTSWPRLQFNFMGPKIYIRTTQVLSDDKPVTGLRLFLEEKKCNRLAMHVQHISDVPDTITHTLSKSNITRGPFQWRGSDEYVSKTQFLEPFRWKRYSNIRSFVVKHDPNWVNQ
nr:MACPF domain-containing protein At1g14780-like [Tanacetum cinerariifolium]